jgi:hypothetical protein
VPDSRARKPFGYSLGGGYQGQAQATESRATAMRATTPAVTPRRSPTVHLARVDRFCIRVVRVLDTATRTASRGTIRTTLDSMPTGGLRPPRSGTPRAVTPRSASNRTDGNRPHNGDIAQPCRPRCTNCDRRSRPCPSLPGHGRSGTREGDCELACEGDSDPACPAAYGTASGAWADPTLAV